MVEMYYSQPTISPYVLVGNILMKEVNVPICECLPSAPVGHADGALMAKTLYMEKLALSMRLPMVKLVDGSSGGGSVTTIRTMGFSYIPPLDALEHVVQQLNAGIPNLGAILGPAIGYGAARVTLCHFSVMAADVGSLFAAGPGVVAGIACGPLHLRIC